MAIEVGTAIAIPGKRTRGELELGFYPDGLPITTPVTIVAGTKPGPTLWLQSSVHGPENGGPVGALRLLNELDPNSIAGTIVFVAHANPLAFRAQTRLTPYDGENLNRVFPGAHNASFSRQTAHKLIETATTVADAIVDLHSGGEVGIVPFYSIYWNDGSEAAVNAGRMARAVGTPDVMGTSDEYISGSLFAQAVKRGVPTIIVECGGGGQVSEDHVNKFKDAIYGVSRLLGILEGEPPRQDSYRILEKCSLVFTRFGGFAIPLAAPGEVVSEGQVVSKVMNSFGDIVEEIRAPFGPAYIAAQRRPYQPIYSGTMMVECVSFTFEPNS